MSTVSDMVRRTFAEGDAKRDAGLTTPDDIVRVDDIPYGKDINWQKLDVYRPKAAGKRLLPVIVSVHGGGWVYGDKELYQYYCMNLAQRGFAVINFTYRLAPEYQHPASLEDTNSVFHWTLKHAEEYRLDTKHFFAVGDSAGAHLLGLYSALCSNREYAKNYSFQPPEGFIPTAIALNCGQYEVSRKDDPDDLTQQLMKDFLPDGGTPEELRQINVLRHITARFPPTFLMTCPNDFLRDEAPKLAHRLMEAQVPFVYRFYGNAEDGLDHVFHCNIRTAAAELCNREECTFFRNYCL